MASFLFVRFGPTFSVCSDNSLLRILPHSVFSSSTSNWGMHPTKANWIQLLQAAKEPMRTGACAASVTLTMVLDSMQLTMKNRPILRHLQGVEKMKEDLLEVAIMTTVCRLLRNIILFFYFTKSRNCMICFLLHLCERLINNVVITWNIIQLPVVNINGWMVEQPVEKEQICMPSGGKCNFIDSK